MSRPLKPSARGALLAASCASVCCALAAAPARADAPTDAASLAHALDRLATTGRVLYVAAHPDDENTRLLAYLANVRHATVAYLSMTRGGGGQNLIGGEQGILLDAIRTEELLAARSLDSARQMFTRMRDFGYSKSADETLALWGREEALADVVWAIRSFQPDVIVTRFSEAPPNHGHHTASAILAREAFAAAADPKRFPAQLAQGVTPWQAKRVLHNLFNWAGSPPPPKDALLVEVNAYDPRLGLAMGELAATSRSQHKSQGFGVPGERGSIVERFVTTAGAPPKTDLLDGVDTGWTRFGAPAAAYARAIDEARRALERDRPERALPALIRARGELDRLPGDVRVRDARRVLDEVIAGAAGLFVRATAAAPVAAPGTTVEVRVEVAARTAPVTIQRVELSGAPALTTPAPVAASEKKLFTLQVPIALAAAPSLPYWLGRPPLPGRYEVAEPRLVGAPRTPPALEATVDAVIAGRALRLVVPVVHAWTDRVHGERVRPFLIVPPATATPVRDAVLAPGKSAPLVVRVRAGRDALEGKVELELPEGWRATPASHAVSLAKLGDETTVRFDVTPGPKAAAGEARPVVRVGGAGYSVREDTIDYAHIPLQLVLRPATVRLVPLQLTVPQGRVGYIAGSGDTVAGDLAHVGFSIDEVDDEALRAGDLARYAAIVIGVRAYNTRAAVRAAHPRLMAYVERGGTLITQYNTTDYTGPLGPLPLTLGRDRITDETAAPTLVDPKHPFLVRPNRIGPADWEGWVQERGLYFGEKWDPRYKPLVRFSDPGEGPLEGALLVAQHGKGRFIYTGLAFFRQLPAGVPGAYRLLANLIAGGAP
ncbi:MAG TPA: PIG-L family deacetylase [Kofleriaceae bacterium]|nr:PIG-L family deacetylase [Kofleriaceae bacterium]